MQEQIIKLLEWVIKKDFDIDVSSLKLGVPPKNMFWDFSFNAWVLARDLRKNPNIIAWELKAFLLNTKNDLIEELEIIWAYLNIKISKNIYTDIFNELYKNKDVLIKNIWKNKTIIIDYIWANVWKTLHIGHMCTPNGGQAMINLYKKIWYNVISDSHIGDWGIIFGKLILAYKNWGNEKELKENAVEHLHKLYIKITEETENNPDLEGETREEFQKLSKADPESVKLWSNFTKESIISMNKQLARLNVKPDYNIWESFYEGLGLPKMEKYPDLEYSMEDIVKELVEKNIATQNEDGSVWVIFKEETKISSCILQKRDWTHGYLASDLAAIKYRVENWNPEYIVYFVDARQQLHLKQTFEIASNAWWISKEKLEHAYNWFISLKDWAMSSRTGKIIKLDKLLDESETRAEKIILEKRDDIKWEELEKLSKIIWVWAIKYGYLKKNRETDVIFDWDEFMSFEWNSGPYIQYAYVRSRKILEKFGWNLDDNNIWSFELKEEIDLVKAISNYNEILEKTSKTNMPHHLCNYIYNLTKTFNSFYNNIHILNEEEEDKKMIRLKLISLFWTILKDWFEILGIEMPEKM